jgi:peptidoglycan/xylan/chitin deacetylase (PgdA/CDA1 family)
MKQWISKLAIVTMACAVFSGCEQAASSPQPVRDQGKDEPAAGAPVQRVTASKDKAQQDTVQQVAAARPAETATPKPAEMVPQGHETGKPKEEPVVSNSAKPAKLSNLKPIYSVGKGTVAITIDDGPTKDTGELLKVLKEQNTHVTFFFIGQNAAAYPESVTEAVYLGHEVGYHSDTHPHMSQMTYDDQEKEFDSGLIKLRKWDKQPVTLFRPPYGAYNNDTKLITEEHHMGMVLWNEDPRDWATTDAAKIAESVLSQVHSGSIIVMHDHPSTIAALPAVIKGIKSKGYKLVTISGNS